MKVKNLQDVISFLTRNVAEIATENDKPRADVYDAIDLLVKIGGGEDDGD